MYSSGVREGGWGSYIKVNYSISPSCSAARTCAPLTIGWRRRSPSIWLRRPWYLSILSSGIYLSFDLIYLSICLFHGLKTIYRLWRVGLVSSNPPPLSYLLLSSPFLFPYPTIFLNSLHPLTYLSFFLTLPPATLSLFYISLSLFPFPFTHLPPSYPLFQSLPFPLPFSSFFPPSLSPFSFPFPFLFPYPPNISQFIHPLTSLSFFLTLPPAALSLFYISLYLFPFQFTSHPIFVFPFPPSFLLPYPPFRSPFPFSFSFPFPFLFPSSPIRSRFIFPTPFPSPPFSHFTFLFFWFHFYTFLLSHLLFFFPINSILCPFPFFIFFSFL